MRRRVVILSLLWCLTLPFGIAQALTPGQQAVLFGNTSCFGPGDVVPGASFFYSFRGYTNSVAVSGTQKSINLRRSTDNAVQDFLILSNCKLDVASAAVFGAGANLFGVTWYDQTPNAKNSTQATAGNQPQLSLNTLTLNFASKALVSTYVQTAVNNLTIATRFSFTNSPADGVAPILQSRTTSGGADTGHSVTMSVSGGGSIFGNANSIIVFDDASGIARGRSTVPGYADGNLHSVVGVFNAGAGGSVAASMFTVYVDNNSPSLNSSNVGGDTTPLTGGQTMIGNYFSLSETTNRNISEIGIWPLSWTASQAGMY